MAAGSAGLPGLWLGQRRPAGRARGAGAGGGLPCGARLRGAGEPLQRPAAHPQGPAPTQQADMSCPAPTQHPDASEHSTADMLNSTAGMCAHLKDLRRRCVGRKCWRTRRRSARSQRRSRKRRTRCSPSQRTPLMSRSVWR
eukprot:3688763-Rhodomonas_salina.1